MGGSVLSKDAALSRHSELRGPEVSGKEVSHKRFQSLLYSEVIISALTSFTSRSLSIVSTLLGRSDRSRKLCFLSPSIFLLSVSHPISPEVNCQ